MSTLQNLYQKARAETAKILGYRLARLTPEQTVRLDYVVTLRLALDDMQGKIVRGEMVDVAKMHTTWEALAKLLPPEVLAPPPAHDDGPDPRKLLLDEYMKMRRSGELATELIKRQRAKRDGSPEQQIATLRAKVAELEAENAALKSAPAPAGANVVPLEKPAPKPAAAPGPYRPKPSFDYSEAMQYVRSDGSISPTPLGGRGRWGPV